MKKFNGYVLAIVEHFIKSKSLRVRLPWDHIDRQVLCLARTLQHKFKDPKDQFWAYDYYVTEKGNPETNGLGHKAMVIEGVKGVLIPSAPIYEISRSKITQLTITQEMDNSDVKLGDGDSIQKKWAEMFECLEGPKATGKYFQLFAAPPAVGASTSSSAIPMVTTGSSEGFLSGDLGLQYGELPKSAATEAEEEEGEAEEEEAPPRKKSRKGLGRSAGPKGKEGKGGAADKEGGGAGTTGKKKGAGRPKRDAVETGQKWLEETINKPRHDPVFTSEAQTESRWLKRPCVTFISVAI